MDTPLDLRPTPEQYDTFACYLREAHSWYKHLSLMQGRQFVVFVAPDAGVGRLVARMNNPDPAQATGYELLTPPEGPEFTEANPRLHHGWRTTEEYRDRFGYLDYMRRDSLDDPYARDVGPVVQLPAKLEQRCSFVLFPYVHPTFTEAVTWDIHAADIQQLRDGASHPGREQVLELAELAQERSAIWNSLNDVDREKIVTERVTNEAPVKEVMSVQLAQYYEIDDKIEAVYRHLSAWSWRSRSGSCPHVI